MLCTISVLYYIFTYCLYILFYILCPITVAYDHIPNGDRWSLIACFLCGNVTTLRHCIAFTFGTRFFFVFQQLQICFFLVFFLASICGMGWHWNISITTWIAMKMCTDIYDVQRMNAEDPCDNLTFALTPQADQTFYSSTIFFKSTHWVLLKSSQMMHFTDFNWFGNLHLFWNL